MNFKKWLLYEGKAMDVSDDMKQFANETIEKLKSKNWKFNQVVHSRVVNSKYGEKNIRIETKPKTESSTADGEAHTNMNLIYLYLPSIKNPEHEPVTFEEPEEGELPVIKSRGTTSIPAMLPDYENIDYQDCFSTIIHEMVHIFDVKLSKRPAWMKKYDTKQDIQDYYNSPHEQDAWMAHRAPAIVSYYLDYYKGDKNKVQKEFSKPPHLWSPWAANGEPEKTWYQNPKVWRKYLNTLYHLLQKS